MAKSVARALLIPGALAGLLIVFRAQSSSLAAILPLAVSAMVGFPLALLLYQGFGSHALPLIAVLVALLLSPLAPLFAEAERARGLSLLALPWLAGAVTLLASFAAIVVPAFSAKAPEHVTLQYVQEADSGNSQWVVYPAHYRGRAAAKAQSIAQCGPPHRPCHQTR